MKYFVIGDYDTVMGFSLVGVPGQIASDAAGASSAFDRALDDRQYGIIIITDEIADKVLSRMDGNADCENGMTWDSLEYHLEAVLREHNLI